MIEKKKLSLFEKRIGYKFKKQSILIKSLTHPSYIFDEKNNNSILNNEFERYEFLGDRVLGLTIASLLFNKFKKFDEGDLSKKYSYLVQKNFLYKISIILDINSLVLYNFSKNNKKMIISILSDTVESLIGAIFIDGGYKSSYSFIKKYWFPYLDIDVSETLDPKTSLQELSQQKSKKLPDYKIIKKEGPSHQPLFTVSLKVLNLKVIKASGSSIREAEKKAALIALQLINEKKNN